MYIENDYKDEYGDPWKVQPVKDTSTKGCGWLIVAFIVAIIISIILSL